MLDDTAKDVAGRLTCDGQPRQPRGRAVREVGLLDLVLTTAA